MAFGTIWTDVGLAKRANAEILGTLVEITHIAFCDANGDDSFEPTQDMTALVHEVYRRPVDSVAIDSVNPAWVNVEAHILAQDGGWWVRALGLFDADGDMVAVGNCSPRYKPILAEGESTDQYFKVVLLTSNTAVIELKIDPAMVLASRAYVDQLSASTIRRLNTLTDLINYRHNDSIIQVVQTMGISLVGDGGAGLYYRTSDAVSQTGDRGGVRDASGIWWELSLPPSRTVHYGLLPGKHVHIYGWGSKWGGNDWCWVRTPPGYKAIGEPLRLVLLNHGNGWTMDGTLATANFSSKCQFGVDSQNGGTYLDTQRADYVRYSSPLIEALLAAGFVVAGAQNDGAHYGGGNAGYGNRETRQNIRDFFYHMIANYNVTPHCHMVGASNGAMASLNAAMLLGSERVRSLTLLYPLCNLYSAWKDTHQDGVEVAYAIGSTGQFGVQIDGEGFLGKTEGHDPMAAYCDFTMTLGTGVSETTYADGHFFRLAQDGTSKLITWVRENRLLDDGKTSTVDLSLASSDITMYRRSIFPWPRIRAHFSLEDTVLPQRKHWQAFKELLSRGGHPFYEEEVAGEHGDYRHFEGLDGLAIGRIINWMNL